MRVFDDIVGADAAEVGKHIFGGIHTAGKAVLSLFGLGQAANALEKLETDAGILPEWAQSNPPAPKTEAPAPPAESTSMPPVFVPPPPTPTQLRQMSAIERRTALAQYRTAAAKARLQAAQGDSSMQTPVVGFTGMPIDEIDEVGAHARGIDVLGAIVRRSNSKGNRKKTLNVKWAMNAAAKAAKRAGDAAAKADRAAAKAERKAVAAANAATRITGDLAILGASVPVPKSKAAEARSKALADASKSVAKKALAAKRAAEKARAAAGRAVTAVNASGERLARLRALRQMRTKTSIAGMEMTVLGYDIDLLGEDPGYFPDDAPPAPTPAPPLNVPVQKAPEDVVWYEGQKGWPRDGFGSHNRWFGTQSKDGFIWTNDPPRWMALRGRSTQDTGGKYSPMQDSEWDGGGPHTAVSTAYGWGPLIGNPSMFPNLRWFVQDNKWGWYPEEAPDWATAEARRQIADLLAKEEAALAEAAAAEKAAKDAELAAEAEIEAKEAKAREKEDAEAAREQARYEEEQRRLDAEQARRDAEAMREQAKLDAEAAREAQRFQMEQARVYAEQGMAPPPSAPSYVAPYYGGQGGDPFAPIFEDGGGFDPMAAYDPSGADPFAGIPTDAEQDPEWQGEASQMLSDDVVGYGESFDEIVGEEDEDESDDGGEA